ncbi:glycoside hydrolase superfamily [Cladochytrium replicatum]|nr:glycoside hydrolase superfamily [Cladochytrium replicatum]
MLTRRLFYSAVVILCFKLPTVWADTYTLIGNWGQNKAALQYADANYQERELGAFCRSAGTEFSVFHINWMRGFFDGKNNPGIDFANHCQWPTNKFSSDYPQSSNGFSLLNCPGIGFDITYCQSLGKKVVLTVSPMDNLSKLGADPNSVAAELWNFFLGGVNSGVQRPFGTAVLDGINFYLAVGETDPTIYTRIIRQLRVLASADSSRSYTISLTVQCTLPDTNVGPRDGYVLSAIPEQIDYLVLWTMSGCGWGTASNQFSTALTTWANFSASTAVKALYLAVPGWYQASWVEGSTLDSIPAAEVISTAAKTIANLGGTKLKGLLVQDVSFNYLYRPCKNDQTISYAALMKKALEGTAVTCDVADGVPYNPKTADLDYSNGGTTTGGSSSSGGTGSSSGGTSGGSSGTQGGIGNSSSCNNPSSPEYGRCSAAELQRRRPTTWVGIACAMIALAIVFTF